MSIHTLDISNRLVGFFTPENVSNISALITKTINQTYKNKAVVVPDDSILQIMQQEYETRLEDIARMNQRVVARIVSEFFNYVNETERNNHWADVQWDSYLSNNGIMRHSKPKMRGPFVGKNFNRKFDFYTVP